MRHDRPGDRRGCATFHGFILALLVATLPVPGHAQLPRIQLEGRQGRITKGPCLLRVYPDRAALMWEADAPGQWGVSCGTRGEHDRYIAVAAEKVTYLGGSGGGKAKTAYIHKVWLDGLLAGRTYTYRIVGSETLSDVYEFRAPAPQSDTVRFIVYGDSRAQPDKHKELVRQMIKCRPDFVVHTGDLVTLGDDYAQWGPQFFVPLKGLMERVPIYVAKGNHEGRKGTFEKLLVPPGEGNDFGFDYGPVHYFCADNYSDEKGAEQLVRRIIHDAAASKAPWKFVSYHEPSVNFGAHWSSWRQSDVLPGFAGAGVDFVVAGHSHLYERFRPIEPPQQAGSYVTYITAGGGGAPLKSIKPTSFHACAKSASHFCLFTITGNTLAMDAIGPDGQTIDHLEITKTAGRPDEKYLSNAVSASDVQRYQAAHD